MRRDKQVQLELREIQVVQGSPVDRDKKDQLDWQVKLEILVIGALLDFPVLPGRQDDLEIQVKSDIQDQPVLVVPQVILERPVQ